MKLKTSKITNNITRYPSIKLSAPPEDASNGNVEKPIFDTTSSKNDGIHCCSIDKGNRKCGSSCALASGIILAVIGIFTIIITPFELLMEERLRMTPGLPPYEFWKSPPDEVLLRMYLFNITNAEEFLNGTATKLRMEEVGPIVYREKLLHSNITFNDNGTLTYVAKRTAIYLPEMNSIDLNATLVLPNLPVLGIPSFFWDAPFFTKLGLNMIIRKLNSQPITTSTIYNYLWNFSDPILDVAQNIAPSMVPTKNMGLLQIMYEGFEHTVTVNIGTKLGHDKFFLIDKYDGSEFLPGLGGKCADKIANSTEGVAYPQYLTKNSTLHYWRKTICKVVALKYQKEIFKYGIEGYKYILVNNTYDRTEPSYEDCYKSNPALPNGLADVSECYYDFPLAASFPHFLYGDESVIYSVDGMVPNKEKHESFALVEPVTGIPLEAVARSQCNLVVRKLSGFNNRLHKFSNMVIPVFWAEYHQVGLPFYISALVYFQVNLLPVLQKVFSALFVTLGTFLIVIYTVRKRQHRKHVRLMKNKALHFETEMFLKDKATN